MSRHELPYNPIAQEIRDKYYKKVSIIHVSDVSHDFFCHLPKRMVLIGPFQDFWSVEPIAW